VLRHRAPRGVFSLVWSSADRDPARGL